MKEDFTVPLNGLAPGRTRFHASAGKTFFAQFENAEVLDADVEVSWEVEKTARELLVDGELEGTLTVVCDRCLEDLALPVVSSFALRIVFVAGETAEEEDADGRETVYADPALPAFDLSQTVYLRLPGVAGPARPSGRGMQPRRGEAPAFRKHRTEARGRVFSLCRPWGVDEKERR